MILGARWGPHIRQKSEVVWHYGDIIVRHGSLLREKLSTNDYKREHDMFDPSQTKMVVLFFVCFFQVTMLAPYEILGS